MLQQRRHNDSKASLMVTANKATLRNYPGRCNLHGSSHCIDYPRIQVRLNWVQWKQQIRETLWDWLQLLIIPLALAIIAIFFNRSDRKNEQRVASDNQQETALQEYIKEMSELLLHEKLRESQP
jgi:hypothetical protein